MRNSQPWIRTVCMDLVTVYCTIVHCTNISLEWLTEIQKSLNEVTSFFSEIRCRNHPIKRRTCERLYGDIITCPGTKNTILSDVSLNSCKISGRVIWQVKHILTHMKIKLRRRNWISGIFQNHSLRSFKFHWHGC